MVLMLTIVVALVCCTQYLGCVALYHAHERRSMVELITSSAQARTALKIAGWCFLLLSVFLCASLQGWERGIAIWLCLIAVTGFASLYVSAYKAHYHVKSGLAALVLTLIFGASLLFIDNTPESSVINNSLADNLNVQTILSTQTISQTTQRKIAN